MAAASASSQGVFPTLRYRDAEAALAWLAQAFGCEEHMIVRTPEGAVVHAELRLGAGVFMLGPEPEADARFGAHAGTGFVYVAIDDPDARFERAVAAGAEVAMPLTDTDYGSRDFAVRDPEGNVWSFGTYRP